MKEIPAYNRVAERFRNEAVKLIYVNVQPDISRPQIHRFIAAKQIRAPMMMPMALLEEPDRVTES